LFPHKECTVQKFIGVDLHKKTIVICVVDQAYRVLERRRFACGETEAIAAWFAGQGEFEVAVEATASYEWFVQLVEGHARRVVLAHPGKLRVIAESTRKSDKIDAHVLADFLARGMLPVAYRPTPRQREHRRLVRYRCWVQGRVTSLKCRIRHILSDYNSDRQDLFTRAGRADAAQRKLLAADRFVLDELWLSLDHYTQRLAAAEQALREFAKSDPPQERQARRRLNTLPGVGAVTIDVFLAETADVRRFGSQKKLTAYAGLAPGQRESGGKRKELGITHAGSRLLRWVLVQAAWQLVRRDGRWQRIFEALAKRRGKKKAIVAIARRLLCLMMAVVVNNRPYRQAA
jgi:transposase